MDWCEQRGLHHLADVMPIHVAAYVEQLPLSRATVKQHLSAISRCFAWMVSGGALETNPATSVQRSKHVVRIGKTPVLSDDQARAVLESISIDKVAGLRDRALIGAMLYTFGRVGTVGRSRTPAPLPLTSLRRPRGCTTGRMTRSHWMRSSASGSEGSTPLQYDSAPLPLCGPRDVCSSIAYHLPVLAIHPTCWRYHTWGDGLPGSCATVDPDPGSKAVSGR